MANEFLNDNFSGVYSGKTVFVTGSRGFKASYLALWLTKLGAKVISYSLDHPTRKGLYYCSSLKDHFLADIEGDVTDYNHILDVFDKYRPEMVFHLAANPLVRDCYKTPLATFKNNALGTATVLDAVRNTDCVKNCIMITSDKCYKNIEQLWGYKENDRLEGVDPYSASKSCASVIISSYRDSFFKKMGIGLAEVRAGNVVGSLDWSKDRLIPDAIRSINSNSPIIIRNRHSTRPWELVLEVLSGYLRVGQKLLDDSSEYSTTFNFGPPLENNKTVGEVIDSLVKAYGMSFDINDMTDPNAPHECGLLYLDSTKAYRMLGWKSKLTLDETMQFTADGYKAALENDDMYEFASKQIDKYCLA